MCAKLNKNGKTLEEFLSEYNPEKYPRPSVTVDAVVFTQDGGLLLIKRANHPFIGEWALAGGFVEENETCETAVARELKEETGVSAALRQLITVSEPNRDPRTRIITVAFVAHLSEPIRAQSGDDASDAAVFKVTHRVKGDEVSFTLTNGETKLCSTVNFVRENGFIDINKSTCSSNSCIAGDHAKIIAYALINEIG